MQAIKKTDVSEEVGLLVLLKQRDNGTERRRMSTQKCKILILTKYFKN